MSRFIKSLALFLTSLTLLKGQSQAAILDGVDADKTQPKPVPLRPLNFPADNLFAGHRSHSSHSSHASHASHYSGSGGSLAPPSTAPAPSPRRLPYEVPQAVPEPSPAPNPMPASRSTPQSLLGLDRPATAVRPTNQQDAGLGNSVETPPGLSLMEKRRIQLMRVQIKLAVLGLYSGQVDGIMNPKTKEAIERFQLVKGLPQTGLMTTPTLNALGVPTAN